MEQDILKAEKETAIAELTKQIGAEAENIFNDPGIVTITDMENAVRAAKNRIAEKLLTKVVDLKKR